ncbi:MAG: hypothetical protein FWE23_05310 [Chitinivibrionia bacterium]|nr:hypothetical protein [Chitinivibrionia bacterium]
MKIPIIRHSFNCENISKQTATGAQSGDNYGKTEKFADIVLDNLLKNVNFDEFSSALFVGTTVGGLDRSESEYLKAKKTDEIIGKSFLRHEAGEMTNFLAEKYKFKQHFTISAACSSGLHAIGLAKKAIEKGAVDFAAAIGSDALCGLTENGFGSLMLIDPSGNAHPFDKNRAGIKLGEGAGGVILCSEKFAKTNNLSPEFYIIGYGSSCDAYHATAPSPNGEGAISAINQAINEAGISPDKIDWICSHGTGTLDNDLTETNAYRAVFGENIPPFMSFKGEIGHTLAASGAIETAMVLNAMKNGIIPPSAGFTEQDEDIGVSPNTQAIDKQSKFVLKTSFGFGGNNSAVVIEMCDVRAYCIRPDVCTLYSGRMQYAPTITQTVKITKSDLDTMKNLLPSSLARRVPTVYQLAYLAAKSVIESQKKISEATVAQAIICVSALGCLDETISFLDKFDETGLGSPKDFVFSTHNSLGGMLAKEFGIKGANFTVCDRSVESALKIAEILDEKVILIVEFDDANEFAEKVMQKCGKTRSNSVSFATAFLYYK